MIGSAASITRSKSGSGALIAMAKIRADPPGGSIR